MIAAGGGVLARSGLRRTVLPNPPQVRPTSLDSSGGDSSAPVVLVAICLGLLVTPVAIKPIRF